jgi:hypothetical protein
MRSEDAIDFQARQLRDCLVRDGFRRVCVLRRARGHLGYVVRSQLRNPPADNCATNKTTYEDRPRPSDRSDGSGSILRIAGSVSMHTCRLVIADRHDRTPRPKPAKGPRVGTELGVDMKGMAVVITASCALVSCMFACVREPGPLSFCVLALSVLSLWRRLSPTIVGVLMILLMAASVYAMATGDRAVATASLVALLAAGTRLAYGDSPTVSPTA